MKTALTRAQEAAVLAVWAGTEDVLPPEDRALLDRMNRGACWICGDIPCGCPELLKKLKVKFYNQERPRMDSSEECARVLRMAVEEYNRLVTSSNENV